MRTATTRVADSETSVNADVNYPRPKIPISPILSTTSFQSADGENVPVITDNGQHWYVSSGRVAIAIALEQLDIGAGDKVLVPAYNCSSMISPIHWLGGEIVFFNLKEDLIVDIDDLESKIDDRCRCVLVAHYFGFPQPIRSIRSICDRYGLALIEDCAHAFFGSTDGTPMGSTGDFAVGSLMKFFPVYDGGCVVSKEVIADRHLRAEGLKFQTKALISVLEKSIHYNRLGWLGWLMRVPLSVKDILWNRTKSLRGESSGIGPTSSEGGFDFDAAWLRVKISVVSRFLFGRVSHSRIVKRRRQLYQKLLESFRQVPGCRPLHETLPESVVPYVFPLIVENPSKVFPALKFRGVPIYRWEQVSEECKVSRKYAEHLLQLPCHQDITDKECEWLVREVKEVVECP